MLVTTFTRQFKGLIGTRQDKNDLNRGRMGKKEKKNEFIKSPFPVCVTPGPGETHGGVEETSPPGRLLVSEIATNPDIPQQRP